MAIILLCKLFGQISSPRPLVSTQGVQSGPDAGYTRGWHGGASWVLDRHGSARVDSVRLGQKGYGSDSTLACYPEGRRINWLARAVPTIAGCRFAP